MLFAQFTEEMTVRKAKTTGKDTMWQKEAYEAERPGAHLNMLS